jgi:hypothetical protein
VETLRGAEERQESTRDQVGGCLVTADQGNNRICNYLIVGKSVAVNLRRHERVTLYDLGHAIGVVLKIAEHFS